MASIGKLFPSTLPIVIEPKFHIQTKIRATGNSSSMALSSSDSSSSSIGTNNGVSFVNGVKESSGDGNVRLVSKKINKKKQVGIAQDELEVLWDDGYGTVTVKDYLESAKDMIRVDGGPPRWFCPVDCGNPLQGSPLLLFLPGIDGVGLGLCLHHKTLGRVFEVRCLHIPVYDRTPFGELVSLVEDTVRLEHTLYPNKPIYLVGDSFGGCLALAVAARNPSIDLVLILVNPATSITKSQLQPIFPLLELVPDELHVALPYLLSFVMGDPIRMASVNIEKGLPPAQMLEQLSANLTSLLPCLSGLADIIPKETLLWKLKLLYSGASYANSRLHAVKAEVLVLASGKDNMLPSREEAQCLKKLLQNCTVRYFKDNSHTLLLEDGIHLLAVIKGTLKYRRSRNHDYISDYIPPSHSDFELLKQSFGSRQVISPVMLSTLDDGKIVRGLAGIPNQGPVLFVGYHMLMGLELMPLVEEFLSERKIMIRGMAHPIFFTLDSAFAMDESTIIDKVREFGSVPVTPNNLYRLLSSKSFTLLYPGGAREALHRKGEEYKLFWPDQPEFVRMAARFEATIVPFGVVGEDDIAQLVLDYDDIMKIPIVSDFIKDKNQDVMRLRGDAKGEIAKQDLYIPGILPKVPGRFYYLFGKPVETKGRKELLKDKESANELYTQIKEDIERTMSYLKEKRETDPYRGIIERTVYRTILAPTNDVPAFEP
ncbi:Acyltransferase-like protein [Thalictrum thalictroides]|uniref:Acyltransferase-like protein n=1 Tax=Thalictrum thalictroides TaxID=46969 RepID=A0A7J6VNI3_THATH|nr:Acyltransferase-like protein [Thalictrum thalictroides]